MKARSRFLRILVLLLWPAAGSVHAALWDPFNGYADISAYQAEVDGFRQDNFRQDYNVAFSQGLAPWVDLRLAYRYYGFDQDFVADLGTYRREQQPSAELRWNHPLFLASGSILRREVDTPSQGVVITNISQAVAKTKDTRYPLLELRYDAQHSYFEELRELRDIRNQRLQLSADWQLEHHYLGYTYSRDRSENVVSAQNSTGKRNLFRWRGDGRPGDGRMQLAGNYTFNHLDQTTVNEAGGPVLRLAPVLTGLYAQTDMPDLVSLDPRPGLADGNLAAPVMPEIDLGGANTGHNLGVDLGGPRHIGAAYVYTDRPSGTQLRWEVWGSEDNITWTRMSASPDQVFNGALNRYELSFDTILWRYIKVVNSGLNEVAQVLVTEFEVFEVLSEHPEDGLQALSHLMDARIDYRFNSRWRASSDISFQVEENPGRDGDRSRGAIGARASYLPSPTVTHSVNWQLSNQWNGAGSADVLESAGGYALAYMPLETLRGSFSLSDRTNWLDGQQAQRNTSGAMEANTDLLYGLTFSAGGSLSRSRDYLAGWNYDTWTVEGRLEASLTRALDLALDASHLESLETNQDDLRVRRVVGLAVDWRLTRSLYARAALRRTQEATERYTVDALFSWNILPAVRVSVQHYEIGVDEAVTTLRQSANLNWDLSARANVYLRLAKVDLTGSGGSRTTSFQQGFRLGF